MFQIIRKIVNGSLESVKKLVLPGVEMDFTALFSLSLLLFGLVSQVITGTRSWEIPLQHNKQ